MEKRKVTRGPGLSAMLKAMIAAVKLVAAEEVMPRYRKVTLNRKGDGSLCTEADIAAQEALTRKLQAILNVPVIGEEMERAEQEALWQQGLQNGLWCIDPIDGTSNFTRGLPYFAVSVALIRNGRASLGVVYDPVADEAFAAEQGYGAFLNGHRLTSVATTSVLGEALVNADLKRLPRHLASQLAAQPPFSSQRNFGACTLDWCYTAAGRFDAYLHGGQMLWDYAAGALILQEAGGHACCVEHDDFDQGDIWRRSAIAALDERLFLDWKDWVREAHRTQ